MRLEGPFLLQQMTAQRSDLMTAKPSNINRLVPCALSLHRNPQSAIRNHSILVTFSPGPAIIISKGVIRQMTYN
jgi:hypothetical protein